MVKNITLSIPEEVANEMDSMPEVNWSSVARKSITDYIYLRRNPDIAPLLEKLEKQKGEEYIAGRKRAEEIVEQNGYTGLDSIMKKYRAEIEDLQEMEYRGFECAPWETPPTYEERLQKVLLEKNLLSGESSTEFLEGLRNRLLQIANALKK